MARPRTRAGRIAGRVLGLTLLSALAVGALSTAVQAKWENHYWGTIEVEGYGSTGKSYGYWEIGDTSDGTKSRLFSNLWLDDADNHTVYNYWETWANSGVCFQPDYTSCDQAYYFYASDESAHQNEEFWDDHYNHTGLPASADYARASIQVALDIPWRFDPMSGAVLTTGSDY